MNHNTNAAKDFTKRTLASLTKRGITLLSATYLPDESGSFTDATLAYNVSDNGTGRVLTFAQVLTEAAREIVKIQPRKWCVVYRTGTQDDFTWRRTPACTEASAVKAKADLEMQGREALISDYQESLNIGLPDTF